MKIKKLISLCITLSVVCSSVGFSVAAESDESSPAQTDSSSTAAQTTAKTTTAAAETTTETTAKSTMETKKETAADTTESTTERDLWGQASTTTAKTTKKTTKKKTTKKTTTTTQTIVYEYELPDYGDTDPDAVAKNPLTGETFKADEITTQISEMSGDMADIALNAVGVSADNAFVYDIEVIDKDGNELVTVNGSSLTISLPLPSAEYDKETNKLYRIDDDEEAQSVDFDVTSDGVTLSVTDFGLYVFTLQETAQASTSSSFDIIPLLIGGPGILASIGAVAFVLIRRKKSGTEEE